MRIPRIYQAIPLHEAAEITLDANASQYLLKVLRLRESDRLSIFDGEGKCFDAILAGIRSKHAIITLQSQIHNETESPLQIHIGLGISKGERMDYAVQKLVETGVSSITPLITEFTVVKLDDRRKQTRHQHWRGVIVSACEQCGRDWLPVLHEAADLSTWLENNSGETKLLFDASGTVRLRDIQPLPDNVSVLIGPEGGLSEHEITRASSCGFELVRLGPRTLRTETAAVAITAALQTLWGDY